ncbi:hypothetical protein B0E47_11820 [Rhodanobacter sp. B05]|jgi:hypothetical protein|uniref:hypothetical protein n=1 Tax=Rhodanobacter sp. B05 TaxID=1945859 RepID=UPI00098674DE|nr:hypothetical protein [Rhodanobacter sp. B05]OOG53882.1 hypothetical protein B0E47_11820 [Rhodanobacter sp. B05]
MKLLRESLLLRALRRLLAGRRAVARRAYVVTVPAPLARPASSNVIELHRRSPAAVGRVPAPADALPSSVHRALVSGR